MLVWAGAIARLDMMSRWIMGSCVDGRLLVVGVGG